MPVKALPEKELPEKAHEQACAQQRPRHLELVLPEAR